MRKRDPTKIFFLCTKLGHLARNCINQGKVEDKRKAKDDNIRSQMKQQWIKKYLDNTNQSPKNIDTQINELGNSTISN